jgi:stage II sporulation protein D
MVRVGSVPPAAVLVLALLLPGVLSPCLSNAMEYDEEPRVRILLSDDTTAAIVKGSGLTVRALDGNGSPVAGASGVSRVSFNPVGSPQGGPGGDMVALGGSSSRSVAGFSVSSSDGFCEVNGVAVRGRLLVTAGRGRLNLVVAVPLEAYLAGLVNGEINSLWPEEAVKAQVVAARTYALRRMARARGDGYDMRADTTHQVYPGVFGEDGEAARAVRATRGLVLSRDGELIEAVFHSNCGGRTASAEEAWGAAVPSLASVPCGDCGDSPQYRWEAVFSSAQLDAAVERLYPGAGSVLSLSIRSLTPSGRVRALAVTAAEGAFLLDASDLRRELGNVALPSTAFSVDRDGPLFVFNGRGYGHGVGLCQWGARGAAERGLSFQEILARYYPLSEVKKAYP